MNCFRVTKKSTLRMKHCLLSNTMVTSNKRKQYERRMSNLLDHNNYTNLAVVVGNHLDDVLTVVVTLPDGRDLGTILKHENIGKEYDSNRIHVIRAKQQIHSDIIMRQLITEEEEEQNGINDDDEAYNEEVQEEINADDEADNEGEQEEINDADKEKEQEGTNDEADKEVEQDETNDKGNKEVGQEGPNDEEYKDVEQEETNDEGDKEVEQEGPNDEEAKEVEQEGPNDEEDKEVEQEGTNVERVMFTEENEPQAIDLEMKNVSTGLGDMKNFHRDVDLEKTKKMNTEALDENDYVDLDPDEQLPTTLIGKRLDRSWETRPVTWNNLTWWDPLPCGLDLVSSLKSTEPLPLSSPALSVVGQPPTPRRPLPPTQLQFYSTC